jgi:hypothetical protein
MFLLAMPAALRAQLACPQPVIPPTQQLDSTKVKQPDGTADLSSVIASVKAALQCYQDNRGGGTDALPKLSSAIFDFKTTTGTVGGAVCQHFYL